MCILNRVWVTLRVSNNEICGVTGDSETIPAWLVPGGLCLLHPCGLRLPGGGPGSTTGVARRVPHRPCAAHCPLHQNPEPAASASAFQTHPLHPSVGGGEQRKIQRRRTKRLRTEMDESRIIWNFESVSFQNIFEVDVRQSRGSEWGLTSLQRLSGATALI